MKPQTEEFLYFLLWSAEKLTHPTFRNLTDSFESWAYRNGLWRQLAVLEKKQLVERDPAASNDRLYRLTQQGRLRALGGRDPQAQWARKWDGRWRLVLFDLPVAQNSQRVKLLQYLHARGFGGLQGSVWITPDPVEKEREILMGGKISVKSLILFEARPCAGESDADIVLGAWDFDHINECYARYLAILDEHPEGNIINTTTANALRRWAAAERAAWLEAMMSDPLLPQIILPPNYLGQTAFRRRIQVLHMAGHQLDTFKP